MMSSPLILQSRDNPQFKRWLSLLETPRAARKYGLALLEGIHLCQTYLSVSGQPTRLIVSEASTEQPEVAALIASVTSPIVILSSALAKTLSQVESGVGVWFEIGLPNLPLPAQIVTDCVILDNLQDPGNVGTILRSAAAAGIQQVFALEGTASLWSAKVLRSGMGAHAYCQLWETSWAELQTRVQVPLYATSSHATQTIYQRDLTAPSAWVFGHEGQGVRAEILQMAQPVSIPQPGGMESLNVGAAATVCLFEQVRQRN